jgi:phage repressor protein C with HTH and peptisase S24 domain
MDEVHPSVDNDGHYIYLIWVEGKTWDQTVQRIKRNTLRLAQDPHDEWDYRLDCFATNLIILHTWL